MNLAHDPNALVLKPDTAYMEVPRCDSCRFWREMQAGLPIVGQAPIRRGVCDKLSGPESKLMLITNNTDARFAVMTTADFGCVHREAK